MATALGGLVGALLAMYFIQIFLSSQLQYLRLGLCALHFVWKMYWPSARVFR